MTSLRLEQGDLILQTPYNRALVDDLKASIPPYGRRWEPQRKVWVIAYFHGQDVVDVVSRHLNVDLAIPKQVTSVHKTPETRIFKIEYIGAVKERDDGSLTATAYCNDSWSVILPLKALREWFEGNGNEAIKPEVVPTLYAILGVKRKATDQEIKRAYRIAAKTWHPDINKDPDATEQFRLVQNAYEILSQQRRKYDAGLRLQMDAYKQSGSSLSSDAALQKYSVWRPPKRCGMLTVEGENLVGRFVVNHILRWDDIINDAGMIMVSYWPKYGEHFEVDWI
jgi:hypothetical protein